MRSYVNVFVRLDWLVWQQINVIVIGRQQILSDTQYTVRGIGYATGSQTGYRF